MGNRERASLSYSHLGHKSPYRFASNSPTLGLRRSRARDGKRNRAEQKGLLQSWISPKDRCPTMSGNKFGSLSRRYSAGSGQCL